MSTYSHHYSRLSSKQDFGFGTRQDTFTTEIDTSVEFDDIYDRIQTKASKSYFAVPHDDDESDSSDGSEKNGFC